MEPFCLEILTTMVILCHIPFFLNSNGKGHSLGDIFQPFDTTIGPFTSYRPKFDYPVVFFLYQKSLTNLAVLT